MNHFPEFDTIIMNANLFLKPKEKIEKVPANEPEISFSNELGIISSCPYAKFKIMPEKYLEENQAIFVQNGTIIAIMKNGELHIVPEGMRKKLKENNI